MALKLSQRNLGKLLLSYFKKSFLLSTTSQLPNEPYSLALSCHMCIFVHVGLSFAFWAIEFAQELWGKMRQTKSLIILYIFVCFYACVASVVMFSRVCTSFMLSISIMITIFNRSVLQYIYQAPNCCRYDCDSLFYLPPTLVMCMIVPRFCIKYMYLLCQFIKVVCVYSSYWFLPVISVWLSVNHCQLVKHTSNFVQNGQKLEA